LPLPPSFGRIRRSRDEDLRTYTITEAADLTGMSRKAIARRVERGSLRSVVRNGRRRIPRSELVRAGLLADGEQQPRSADPAAPFLPRPASGAELAETGTTEDMLATLFREVLDRFERQSQEIAQYRALTVQAESLRLTNELADLRVRLAELERQPEKPSEATEQAQALASDLGKRVSELTQQVEELSQREIWLPPQAAAPPQQPVAARPMPPAQPRPAAPPQPVRPPAPMPMRRPIHLSRTYRFVLEAAFIVAVAVIVWQADLPTPAIAVAMGIAWTLVAVVEWLSSERPDRR
jgi:excisionase family DNA binding protein